MRDRHRVWSGVRSCTTEAVRLEKRQIYPSAQSFPLSPNEELFSSALVLAASLLSSLLILIPGSRSTHESIQYSQQLHMVVK